MVANYLNIYNNRIKYKFFNLLPYVYIYLLPVLSWAQPDPDPSPDPKKAFGELLVNLSRNFPAIVTFLNGICVIIGVSFIMLAFFKLKHLADFRNMMSGQQEIGKSITLIVLGAVFLWMPFILNAMTYTLFGMQIGKLQAAYPISDVSSAPYAYAFFAMMQIVGLVSFIRGWLILSSMSKGQPQHGTLGRAITHLVGGLLLFHLNPIMKILDKTLGMTFI
ncbi:MAG: hypothetical protein KBD64_00225 [Gammaproteobacteria bacterium]|nr:hypothetical protein [Gammaproteobacteria bacterium]